MIKPPRCTDELAEKHQGGRLQPIVLKAVPRFATKESPSVALTTDHSSACEGIVGRDEVNLGVSVPQCVGGCDERIQECHHDVLVVGMEQCITISYREAFAGVQHDRFVNRRSTAIVQVRCGIAKAP